MTARNQVYPEILRAERSPLESLLSALKRVRKSLRSWRKSLRKPTTMAGSNYALARHMLADFCEVFNDANIRYMVDQGTLIGISREGDFLPWDDDVDIDLPQDQVEKVLELLPVLKSKGWRIRKRYMHYSFHSWEGGDLQCLKIRKMRWVFLRSRLRMDINIKYRLDDKYHWHSMRVTCEVDARHFDKFEEMVFSDRPSAYPRTTRITFRQDTGTGKRRIANTYRARPTASLSVKSR